MPAGPTDTQAWRAESIGDAVPLRVSGTVHSVFAHACNIETASGDLVTLLASTQGNGPRGIKLAHAAALLYARLSAGQEVLIGQAQLRVPAAAVAIDFAGARVWSGEIAAVSPNVCARALRRVRSILCERVFLQGFVPLIAGSRPAQSAFDRAFIERLSSTLPALAQATVRHDSVEVAGIAAQLVGLGPGLTPSGDDFLTGYLAALWSRAGTDGGIAALLTRIDVSLTPLFLRTNAISRQMLRDAVQGRFAEHLLDVISALAHAGDVVHATMRALESGHSSGADTLCGLLFGYAPHMAIPSVSGPLMMRSKLGVGALAWINGESACPLSW